MGKLADRLSKKEINELMKNGSKIREKNLTFIFKKGDNLKVAFIPVGTKGAVEKNRLKRKIREIFLKFQDKFDKLYLAIIIPPFIIRRDELIIFKDFERFLERLRNEKVDFNIN